MVAANLQAVTLMVNWKGTYNAASSYSVDDGVTFTPPGGTGGAYVAIAPAAPGVDPTNSAVWLYIGPAQGPIPPGIAYGQFTGDGVTSSFVINHGLGLSSPFLCSPRFFYGAASADQEVVPELGSFTANSLTATFVTPPANGQVVNWIVVGTGGGFSPFGQVPGIAPLSSGRFVGANKVGALVYTGTGGASATNYRYSTVIPVNPGDQMVVSAYVDATACSVSSPTVQVMDTGITTSYAVFGVTIGTAGWYSSTFTVPSGVTQVVVLLNTSNATVANGGKLVWACLRLELGQYANPFNAPGNLVPDPGFLNGLTSWPGSVGAGLVAVAPGTVPGQFTPPSGPPASGTWQKNDMAEDETGKLYVCSRGGTVGANLESAIESDFEGVGTGNWFGAVNCSVANTTVQAHTGTHSMSLTATALGTGYTQLAAQPPVTPNLPYTATAWVRAATTARAMALSLIWFGQAGNFIGQISSPPTTDSSSAWTRLQISGSAPANASSAGLQVVFPAGTAAGEVHYVDTVSLVPDVTWVRPGAEDRLLVPGGERSIEPVLASNNVAGGSGYALFSSFIAARSETVSNLTFLSGATPAGATPSLVRFGLYWLDPVNATAYLIGSTANDPSIFASAGAKYTRSLTNPVAKVAGQRYAVSVIVVTTATAPNYVGSAGLLGPQSTSKANLRGFYVGGQSDLPASLVAANYSDLQQSLYAEVTT